MIFLTIAVENDVDETRPELTTGKTNWISSIGHFRVTLCLCFKTSLRVKPFIWKWLWFAWKWTCRQNTFPYEWSRAKFLFWRRGQANSKIGYWLKIDQFSCTSNSSLSVFLHLVSIKEPEVTKETSFYFFIVCHFLGGDNKSSFWTCIIGK